MESIEELEHFKINKKVVATARRAAIARDFRDVVARKEISKIRVVKSRYPDEKINMFDDIQSPLR
jgi:hypothetical protein